MPRLIPLFFPVWNFACCADPYMEAIRHIRRTCAHDPKREAALVGSVFDQAHNELSAVYSRQPSPAELQEAVEQLRPRLAVCHG